MGSLLALCGLTPQIITETLYALWQDNALPHRIVVLTTNAGRIACMRSLFGTQGALRRLYAACGIDATTIHFDADSLYVPDVNGEAIDDINTPEASAAFLSCCMKHAFALTQDMQDTVYFSLAGGRKTMGASLALAAQCYGRVQDRLFHVLVTPSYEGADCFFFPTPHDSWVTTTAGARLNARDACVTLADMPFLRLRSYIPAQLLHAPQTAETLLHACSLGQTAPTVTLSIPTSEVRSMGRTIRMPPTLFALLLYFARHKRDFSCAGVCGMCDGLCFLSGEMVLRNAPAVASAYAATVAASSVHSSTGIRSLSAENFMAYKAKLRTFVRRHWGETGVDYMSIISLGVRPYVRYGLRVAKGNIYIQEE